MKDLVSKKILLITTPETIGEKHIHSLPPLGILYLASYLNRNGVNAEVFDWNVIPITVQELVSKIGEQNYDLVGISSVTDSVSSAILFSKTLKKQLKEVKICLGGAHANGTKDEIYNYTKDIDFLVYGEGEETLLELVNSLDSQQFNKINGLIYINNDGKVITNPPRSFIEDLDSLPFPDLNLIDIDNYSILTGNKKPVASLMASRGCPFRCSFCDVHTVFGRKLRIRSYTNVVDEIQYMVEKHNIKEIFIKDSTFTINKEWVKSFCDELKKRNIKISYLCNTRVDSIDEELLAKMKKSGCRQICFGIESADDKILKTINKKIKPEQVIAAFRLAKKYKIQTTGFFMIGNPGETEETVRKTINLAKAINPDYARFSIATPYPNTDLYKWCSEKDCIGDKYWYMRKPSEANFHSLANNGVLNLRDLPPSRQVELRKRAYREFYLRPKYILNQLAKIRSFEDIIHSIVAGWGIIKS